MDPSDLVLDERQLHQLNEEDPDILRSQRAAHDKCYQNGNSEASIAYLNLVCHPERWLCLSSEAVKTKLITAYRYSSMSKAKGKVASMTERLEAQREVAMRNDVEDNQLMSLVLPGFVTEERTPITKRELDGKAPEEICEDLELSMPTFKYRRQEERDWIKAKIIRSIGFDPTDRRIG